MYTLYFDKSKMIIKVKKASKALSNCTYTNEVVQYNSCYYLCLNRKPLIEKATEIKESWISEFEEKLEKAKAIKF